MLPTAAGQTLFPIANPSPTWVRSVARACGWCVVGIGGLVLIGWMLDIDLLKRVVQGRASMNPITAVACIATAAAILLRSGYRVTRLSHLLAMLATAFVMTIGVARLAEYATDLPLHIDRVLFTSSLDRESDGPNRMAPNTAFNFAFCGLSLLLLDVRVGGTRRVRPAHLTALLVGVVAILALTGHFYGVSALYGWGRYIGMSIPTAAAFLLLSFALLLLRADCGLVELAISNRAGGLMLRRLLPAVLALPPAVGWIALKGQDRGAWDARLGMAMSMVVIILMLGFLVMIGATRLTKLTDTVRLSEERLGIAVHGSSDGLWDWAVNTEEVWYSPRFRELIGYSEEEFPGVRASWHKVVHPDDLAPTLRAVERHFEADEPFDVEYRLRTRSGEYRWFRARGKAIRDPQGKPTRMAGSISDITALKRAQEMLASQEAEIRTILNSTADGIIAIDSLGTVMQFNAAAEAMFGYSSSEVIGRNVSMLMPSPYHEGHDEYLARYLRTGEARILGSERELEGQKRDGSLFPIALRVRPIARSERSSTQARAFVGVVQDISVRRKLERIRDDLLRAAQESSEELARSNRDLEEFAYVASHDLRAPLRAIKNLVEWMDEDLRKVLDDDSREKMRLLVNRVGRLETLIADLLEYSRAGRILGKTSRVDVGKLIETVIELLSPPKTFEVAATTAMPTLETVGAPLQQVISNLISNAIKHHDRPAGRIEIACRDTGDYYEFRVSDDGPGIPSKYHERVFKLFETLKPRDEVEGSGIGLSVVRRTVEKLGGTIRLDSSDSRGTTFTFTWPKSLLAMEKSTGLMSAPAFVGATPSDLVRALSTGG